MVTSERTSRAASKATRSWQRRTILAVVAFLSAVTFAAAQPPRRVSYDFTGDASSDLLFRTTPDLGSTLTYIGFWDFDGPSVVNATFVGAVTSDWTIVGVGDYNGDRTSDILFRQRSGGAIGYWAIVNGSFSTFVPLSWSTPSEWTVVSTKGHSDLNGDGRDDVLWRRTSGELSAYLLRGGGPFEFEPVSLGTFDPLWAVAGTGDFDGDGTEDILWRHTAAGIVGDFRMVNGAIQGWTELGTRQPTWQIAAINDFDGDGAADVYWQHPWVNAEPFVSEGYWNINAGQLQGFVALATPFTTIAPTWGLNVTLAHTGDYFGDGSSDIISQYLNFFCCPPVTGPTSLGLLSVVSGNPTTRIGLSNDIRPWVVQ